jgi:cation diffusion facilitator family transporter
MKDKFAIKKDSGCENKIEQIKLLIDLSLYTLIPLTVLFFVAGILANSLTIFSVAMECCLGFIVEIFAYKSIRVIQRSNRFRFPYGTGKLENFTGFLTGALSLPISIYILYFSVVRVLSPEETISFTISQIPLLPSLARSVYFFIQSRKLMQKVDSPLVKSYYIDFKVSTYFDAGLVLAFAMAWVLTCFGKHTTAYYLDPVISFTLAFYMGYMGIKQVVGNFRILMDLPLPEEEQLLIMRVLAQEYEHYENIGNVFSRRSGQQRFIDIELFLKKDIDLKAIMQLKARMKKKLEEHFGEVKFNLIPLIE